MALDDSKIVVVVSEHKRSYLFLKENYSLPVSYLTLNFEKPLIQRLLFERALLVIFELPQLNKEWEKALQKMKIRYKHLQFLVLSDNCPYASISRLLQTSSHFFIDSSLSGEALFERVSYMIGRTEETATQESYHITRSKFMRKVSNYVNSIPKDFQFILLSGETGTGKTSLARWIHRLHFAQTPFIEVNAGSICHNLHHSELFGSTKGAFTGAVARDGIFHAPQESIILINEIQNFPYTTQKALLQVFDNGKFYRLGSNRNEVLAAKIICTAFSPKNEDHTVCTDLWYRIAQLRIHLPTLRERAEDIPQLARYFLKKINRQQSWSKSALELLQEQPWPGNLRQLRSFTEALSRLYLTSHRRVRISKKHVLQALNDFQGG